MNYRKGVKIIIAIFSISWTGCEAPTGTLQGKISLAGKKVSSGSIVVHVSQDSRQNPRGVISEDGTYVIANVPKGTFPLTIHSHARMPEGMQLKQKLPPTDDNGPASPSAAMSYSNLKTISIPRKYTLPEESGLSASVKPGVQILDIELK